VDAKNGGSGIQRTVSEPVASHGVVQHGRCATIEGRREPTVSIPKPNERLIMKLLCDHLLTLLVLAWIFAPLGTARAEEAAADSTTQEEQDKTENDATGGQSRESMAVDATATQWSYQFAIEGNLDYADDITNGMQRPEGNKGFLQLVDGTSVTATSWPVTTGMTAAGSDRSASAWERHGSFPKRHTTPTSSTAQP